MSNNNDKSAFGMDLERFYSLQYMDKITFFRKLRLWLTNFGLHCVATYRFGQFARKLYRKNKLVGLPFRILSSCLNLQMELLHHVSISENLDIGPGFFISHASNIYIGGTSFGRNFTLSHNVTIGWGYAENKFGLPEIGDNVWVGTGAIITGNIKIGGSSAISAGSVVAKDIPPKSFVAGNPARVLIQDYQFPEYLMRVENT